MAERVICLPSLDRPNNGSSTAGWDRPVLVLDARSGMARARLLATQLQDGSVI